MKEMRVKAKTPPKKSVPKMPKSLSSILMDEVTALNVTANVGTKASRAKALMKKTRSDHLSKIQKHLKMSLLRRHFQYPFIKVGIPESTC
jgi:hypothetical protein